MDVSVLGNVIRISCLISVPHNSCYSIYKILYFHSKTSWGVSYDYGFPFLVLFFSVPEYNAQCNKEYSERCNQITVIDKY